MLTVFTLGLYYFIWQYRQFKIINALNEKNEHSFVKWFFLSIMTFGLYHVYHEYLTSKQILVLQEKFGLKKSHETFPLFCLVFSAFGVFLVVDIIHQEELNKIIQVFQLKCTDLTP